MTTQKTAYLTFSTYYLFASSMYAFALAFLPLHCRAIGFDPFEIAVVSIAGTVATMFASPLMLQLAYQFIGSRLLLRINSTIALALFIPLFFAKSFLAVLSLWGLCIMAKQGGDSLVDARAVRASAQNLIRFERVRVWGSIGFMAMTLLLGRLIDLFGVGTIVPSTMTLMFFIWIAAIFTSRLLPETPGRALSDTTHPSSELSGAYLIPLVALIVSLSLIWASHSILYVYLSLYLDALGWSAVKISYAWNLGVIAEVLFFFSMKWWEPYISLKSVFQISVAATILRWLILYQFTDPTIIMLSQVLHGLSFGGCYISSMKLVYVIVPEKLKDRGQGLLVGVGGGLGSLFGRFHAGTVAASLSSYTEVSKLFLYSAGFATLAFIASLWISLPKGSPKKGNDEGA